jgi:starvation-inducible DNA-binding protein
MHRTKIDIAEASRLKLLDLLNARLADGIDLMMQAKQAHWNVKDPSSVQLHELFEKVNDETEGYIDLIAERAVQLAGTAEGTIRVAAKRSTLEEYPLQIADGRAHVDAVSSAISGYAKATREAITQADQLGDADTVDLFKEVSGGLEKLFWMIEAHVQAEG